MLYKIYVDAETNPKRVMIVAWDSQKEIEPMHDKKFIEVAVARTIPDTLRAIEPYFHLEEST